MRSFLEEVSEYILSNTKELKSLEIIVPNRRTGLFLKKYISEQTSKTIWLPKITPIQEIFYNNSNLHIAEEIVLIYQLYKIFIEHTKSSESFDDFYYWGEIILADFDDIDKYLVDAEKLFSTVADIKEIDQLFDGYEESSIEIIKKFWYNVNQAQISSHKESFLKLWQSMYNIYTEYKLELKDSGIAYQGMIYKEVIENITNCPFKSQEFIIVGFNALNKCEKELFKHLKSNYHVDFFWDADKYYIQDKHQEAGKFIRENIKYFPPVKDYGLINNINTVEKNIEVIMVPSPISQTKLIPQIVNNWQTKNDFNPEKTAIVLGDENLLIPLMYSIPDTIDSYNVSMGFPVKNSMSVAFINHLISLQQRCRIYKREIKFFYKDVLSILEHSFIRMCEQLTSEDLKNYIVTNKIIYISEKELWKSTLLKLIFSVNNKSISVLSKYLTDTTGELISKISSIDSFAMENEILNKVQIRLNALHDCIISNAIEFESDKVFLRLLNQSIKSLNVAFEGEPLKGLQILGFLETRSLDFDNVIMLSINEGIFPKKSVSQSLIPYNLRRFHELPSIEFQDSIFAYYFYRLFQKAKNIKIIYCNQSGENSSEASRFISQIKYELNQEITFSNKAYKIELDKDKINIGKKTDKILSKIETHLQNGISPKAINEYLNCPFKYYLRYIENIKEPDKIEEAEDSAFFGTIFHEVMQYLYSPYIDKIINKDDFKNFTQNTINAALEKTLRKILKTESKQEIENFKNKIIVEIVLKYVQLLLKYDSNNTPFTIKGLEKEEFLNVKLEDCKFDVKVKGNIDRIDIHNNIIRVFDYKTGKTEVKFTSIDQLFDNNRKPERNIITQVILYSLMYKQNSNMPVCPCILNVNSISSDYNYRLKYNKNYLNNIDSEFENSFVSKLQSMFMEMLNTKIPFIQTENIENCKYCPYINICNK